MDVRWPVRGLGCAPGPGGQLGKAAVRVGGRSGRRVEGALEWLPAREAAQQFVVEGEDAVLRAVVAVSVLVLALDNWESVPDVRHRTRGLLCRGVTYGVVVHGQNARAISWSADANASPVRTRGAGGSSQNKAHAARRPRGRTGGVRWWWCLLERVAAVKPARHRTP